MTTRRRYSKAERVAAVMTAELTNATAAAGALHIPETNIRRWQDDPELAEYGAKTREDLADATRTLANLAAEKLLRAVKDDKLAPRDLLVAFGLAVDKSQLLSGEATSRTETADVTARLTDHETEALQDLLDEALESAK